jgi:glycerate kinase
MRIICAPDSFKESISATAAAEAMARGVQRAKPDAEVDICPIADGGEGTVDALVAATAGQLRRTPVTGPLGEPVVASWGLLGDGVTAVIEMAAAAGLALVPAHRRDPTRTTTFGVGELIRAALDAEAQRIILGIGGSGTNDGGAGAAQALGVAFYRGASRIEEPMSGGHLAEVTRVDLAGLDARLKRITLAAACDVTNPLTGPTGAAATYAPQKGATPEQVAELDAGLAGLASLFEADPQTPGYGAAGGMGFGATVLLGGRLKRGIDLVLDAVRFGTRVAGCDLCLTGEGRMDGQSASGKAISGVAVAAKRRGVPVVALVGSVGSGVEAMRELGVQRWLVIGEGLPREESMSGAGSLIEAAAARAIG